MENYASMEVEKFEMAEQQSIEAQKSPTLKANSSKGFAAPRKK